MKNFVLSLVMVSVCLSIGCGCSMQSKSAAAPASATAAGQPVNAWEGNAFRALLDSQAGLLKATQQVQSGELPLSLKPDLNRAIALQNTLVLLLKAYDQRARAGGDLTASQNEIENDLTSLTKILLTLKPATAAASQ